MALSSGVALGKNRSSMCSALALRRPAILEEDDVPAPPMGANRGEEGVMRFLDPCVGDQQEQRTTPATSDLDELPLIWEASPSCP
jgi:hypothetical protein